MWLQTSLFKSAVYTLSSVNLSRELTGCNNYSTFMHCRANRMPYPGLEGANLIIQRDRLLTRIELSNINTVFLLILHQL
jgi:hypothetical protein